MLKKIKNLRIGFLEEAKIFKLNCHDFIHKEPLKIFEVKIFKYCHSYFQVFSNLSLLLNFYDFTRIN